MMEPQPATKADLKAEEINLRSVLGNSSGRLAGAVDAWLQSPFERTSRESQILAIKALRIALLESSTRRPRLDSPPPAPPPAPKRRVCKWGKSRFTSGKKARQHMRAIRGGDRLRVYECEACAGWHYTSQVGR